MESERHTPPIDDSPAPSEQQRTNRIYRWVEILSAAMLALTTVATAWCGYQSALWNGEQNQHLTKASTANIRAAKFANLAQQKLSLHVGLFGQWASAASTNNSALANFLSHRFPEPLKAASFAWHNWQRHHGSVRWQGNRQRNRRL